jgi:hypothetical protein
MKSNTIRACAESGAGEHSWFVTPKTVRHLHDSLLDVHMHSPGIYTHYRWTIQRQQHMPSYCTTVMWHSIIEAKCVCNRCLRHNMRGFQCNIAPRQHRVHSVQVQRRVLWGRRRRVQPLLQGPLVRGWAPECVPSKQRLFPWPGQGDRREPCALLMFIYACMQAHLVLSKPSWENDPCQGDSADQKMSLARWTCLSCKNTRFIC